jgi:O-antigen ligase
VAEPQTKSRKPSAAQPAPVRAFTPRKLFPWLMGIWIAVTFAKFGNPVIFGNLIEAPHDGVELVINSWPPSWGYFSLALVGFWAVTVWKSDRVAPKWILILPLVWLGWQLISARLTVNAHLTQQALLDFAGCALCFYLGIFALSRSPTPAPIWAGLLAGLLFCLWTGLGQHFGGLEQMRQYVENIHWELYPPEMKAQLTSPEFQQKIASNRIFGTFVYPNALAGGIILALPAALLGLWGFLQRVPFVVRGILAGIVAWFGLACLFWSGSKAGWLIMLGLGLLVLVHLKQLSSKLKLISVAIVLATGLGGFYATHSAYFAKKNNSTAARLDYWRAAWELLKEKPIFGSGPGTFTVGYQRLKRPEAEPAKLAHNDYLQQGSDSGLVGLGSFLALIGGSIFCLYRRIRPRAEPMLFAIWLGAAGLAAQEFVEFSLYIPALAWPFFLMLGWLWGVTGRPASPSTL